VSFSRISSWLKQKNMAKGIIIVILLAVVMMFFSPWMNTESVYAILEDEFEYKKACNSYVPRNEGFMIPNVPHADFSPFGRTIHACGKIWKVYFWGKVEETN
jgi:hypothetical protein